MESRDNFYNLWKEISMKLKRGTKPIELDIPFGTRYSIKRIGDYIEIEIDDVQEIARLRAKGFTNL